MVIISVKEARPVEDQSFRVIARALLRVSWITRTSGTLTELHMGFLAVDDSMGKGSAVHRGLELSSHSESLASRQLDHPYQWYFNRVTYGLLSSR